MRFGFVALAIAFASVALGGCNVDVSVGVDARRDGTGEVRVAAVLDADAARTIGDLDERLRTDDLRDAGWTVGEPDERSDGSVELVATHPFDDEQEVAALVTDVAGDPGPLEGFVVRQARDFFRTETTFAGNVDLVRGIESFSDERLAQSLGGSPLGISVDELERRLGASVDRVFGLQVAARLPGALDSNAPTETGNGAVWSPKLGDQLRLEASATQWNVRNIGLLAVAVVSGLAALGTALARARVRRVSR